MKKLFAAVFLISIFAIVGCASDNTNSSAQAPVEEPLIPADPNNPSTLIGHYKVDYFTILQGATLVSTDCNLAKQEFPNFTCNAATFLANLADIQLHNEEGMGNIYSFVIQMQLNSPEIRGETLKEHAYHHLFFPIPEDNMTAIKEEIKPFNTRATERGLSSFFLSRPTGGRGNTNAQVTTLIKDGEQLYMRLHEQQNNSVFYAVRLTKTSNNSNGYVTKYDQQGLVDIIYAVSSRFNELIQSTFEDDALKTLFNGFKNDFPNTPGDPITQ